MTTEINYYGVQLSVEYTVDGKYISATHEYPEEHSDITIESISAVDSFMDLQNILSWEQIDEIVNLIEI